MKNKSDFSPIASSSRGNEAPKIQSWKIWKRWIEPPIIRVPKSSQSVSLSLRERAGVRGNGYKSTRLGCLVLIAVAFISPSFAQPTTPSAPVHSDLTLLQCGNLIYAGNKSSVCFADKFLSDLAEQTNLRVNKTFCPVRLDADALFDFPFCVMSGNETFSLTQKEREQLRKYLVQGGFLLVSPGCSDEKWDKAFRQEIKVCFPEYALQQIPLTHPIFSTVNRISRLTEKHGKPTSIEGLEINGRLVMVYSKDGLNDVHNASGCCCCGGNEVEDPARVNVNIFTYAVLY
jgi:hypothetical protein